MKISVITPVYKDSKHLGTFLEKIAKQTSKSYELILVVDTNNDLVLKQVDEYRKKLGQRLRVIFNSKRTSRTIAINEASLLANGQYSLITSLRNNFDKNLIKDTIEIAKEKDADIIEFKAKMSSPIKLDGNIRKTFNKKVEIQEHPEVIAYTFPLDFNKIYRTSVLEEVAKLRLPVRVNSRFAIAVPYLALMQAKTYATSNTTLITNRSVISNNFNPLKIMKQWTSLVKFIKDYTSIESVERYIYAQYFSEAVIISGLVRASKSKVITKKFNDQFRLNQKGIYDQMFETNKYVNNKSKEYKELKSNKSVSNLHKNHKEF